MTDAAVIREIRATREAFAGHGYDVYKMIAALRAKCAERGRSVVTLPPRLVATETDVAEFQPAKPTEAV